MGEKKREDQIVISTNCNRRLDDIKKLSLYDENEETNSIFDPYHPRISSRNYNRWHPRSLGAHLMRRSRQKQPQMSALKKSSSRVYSFSNRILRGVDDDDDDDDEGTGNNTAVTISSLHKIRNNNASNIIQ